MCPKDLNEVGEADVAEIDVEDTPQHGTPAPWAVDSVMYVPAEGASEAAHQPLPCFLYEAEPEGEPEDEPVDEREEGPHCSESDVSYEDWEDICNYHWLHDTPIGMSDEDWIEMWDPFG